MKKKNCVSFTQVMERCFRNSFHYIHMFWLKILISTKLKLNIYISTAGLKLSWNVDMIGYPWARGVTQ